MIEAHGTVLATASDPVNADGSDGQSFRHMRFELKLPLSQAHAHTHGPEPLPARVWRVCMPVYNPSIVLAVESVSVIDGHDAEPISAAPAECVKAPANWCA